MPADLAHPPDVSAWTAQRSEADTGTAVETPPAQPDAPVAPAIPDAPAAPAQPEAPAGPSPAEEIVQGLAKAGMTPEQAQALVTKATTPQPVKDALEAFLDGKPYPVPKNLMFKLKSGATVQEKTLEQLQREGLLYNDYQRRTQDFAREKREHQQSVAQWTARDAALREREKWFEEQRNEMIAAQKDPKKWEEYQEIQRLRTANPSFDKLFQDAMKAREDGAQRGVMEQAVQAQQIEAGVDQALTWIQELSSQYPGVDPERVRLLVSYAWANQHLPYGPDAIKQTFEGEAKYLQSAASPVETQVAELRATIDAMKAEQEAAKHNAGTARALERAKAPNTSPAGGGPAAPVRVVEKKPIPPDRHAFEQAVSDWSKVRDQ